MIGRIRINDEIVTAAEVSSALEVEPGVWSVIREGRSYEVRVAGPEVFIGRHRVTFEIDDPRQWKRTGAGAETHGRALIKAQMPGKIVRVLVSVGDEVAAGQGILVVEAMKMQNEMKALVAGRVVAVEVAAGDTVSAGMLLAAIE